MTTANIVKQSDCLHKGYGNLHESAALTASFDDHIGAQPRWRSATPPKWPVPTRSAPIRIPLQHADLAAACAAERIAVTGSTITSITSSAT
jgi:hypothetical protein